MAQRNVGFLAWCESGEGEARVYDAALLLTDGGGQPLEFRYTAPMALSPLQQALYGESLLAAFVGRVLLQPLMEAVPCRPQVWLVQQAGLLDLRPAAAEPVLAVSAGDPHPRFTTRTGFADDLEVLPELYEQLDVLKPFEIFARMQAAFTELKRMTQPPVVQAETSPPPPPEAAPEVPAAEEDTGWMREPDIDLSISDSGGFHFVAPQDEAPPLVQAEAEAVSEVEVEAAPPEKPKRAAPVRRDLPEQMAALDQVIAWLLRAEQLQPTHLGYAVAGNLMWIHRAHFLKLAEAVATALEVDVEIDRDLLRRAAQAGNIEAFEVYKEMYGKMAVAFKLDLRKFPQSQAALQALAPSWR